jgi:hypothetical protein
VTRRATRSLEHWILLAGATAALLGLVVFALWVPPDPRGYGTHERLGLPPCAAMELWNVPCPGCGVTTSLALAAHGRLLASFLNQPFGCALALAVPCAFVFALVQHARGRDLRRELERRPALPFVIAIVAFVAASWLYKLARVRGWIG